MESVFDETSRGVKSTNQSSSYLVNWDNDRRNHKSTLLCSSPSHHHGQALGCRLQDSRWLLLSLCNDHVNDLVSHLRQDPRPLHIKIHEKAARTSFKQRMGIGLLISCLSTSTAALVEKNRRAAALKQGLADNPLGLVNMSAMWLVPHICLIGLAEAFNAIGQVEFYYSQFPKSMSSIAVTLFLVSMAIGKLVGSLIVGVINHVTHNPSWVSNNLNQGHYDYYYWVLTVLSGINFFYYLICSWAYGPCEGEYI